ncbi:IncL/M type plasmid replication protein RepC, partial [Citrobacter freundii]|uniref:IncL/M type plasmid replication protein RepC n=1 Tax=Citrobacter freundii TaxID=546 RepID=UPI001CD474E3
DSSKPTCRQNRCCKNGSDHRFRFLRRPQLNLYLPKDAKRMLIEITKVKKLTQAEVIEFLVKSYYDGLKFDDSEE